jgi:hypothetical protein
MKTQERLVCVYEDRADHTIGVKLLALSLLKFEPSWRIVFFSSAPPDHGESSLSELRNVTVRNDVPKRFSAWNVKPALLLKLLDEGNHEATWIDSDIVLTAPITPVLEQFPKEALVVTEEYRWGMKHGALGGPLRTRLWGLPVGRQLGFTVNSCFVRVNQDHAALLAEWMRLIDSPLYRAAQDADWAKRPTHMVGDQDALCALLGSTRFAQLECRALQSGVHVAQCFQQDGYSVHDRVTNWRRGRLPPLVHAQGTKPWTNHAHIPYLELSPYPVVARELLEDAEQASWLYPQSTSARVIDSVFNSDPNLRGILHAAARLPSRIASTLLLKVFRKHFEAKIYREERHKSETLVQREQSSAELPARDGGT